MLRARRFRQGAHQVNRPALSSSVARVQQTVDTDLNPTEIIVEGRHDPSVCPRAVPVAEAMLANLLADLVLRNRSARIDWD